MRSQETLTEDSYLVTHDVGPNQQGVRLDHFLMKRYYRRSREAIKRAIDAGSIYLERDQSPHLILGKLKASLTLYPGDKVFVRSVKKPEPEVDFNFRILFEDEDLLVLDKPGNLPVHPAGRYFFNSLLMHLRTHGHAGKPGADTQYYLVHRLDKETSGVLVLTKSKHTATHIIDQFADRLTSKRYYAIVNGHAADSFKVDRPMKKATDSPIELKMALLTKEEERAGVEGVTSSTEFRTLKRITIDSSHPNYSRFEPSTHLGHDLKFSLVECFPKTGRQHQLRVHLESVGHPIVGDKLYGLPDLDSYNYFETKSLSPEALARLIILRHALHSSYLSFKHPITGRLAEFHSPLPAELNSLFGFF